ncbi:MAG: helix-turn-helix domain-containing protein [Deltaproteobacteria bacterium]|nr:helix-turn-helix domain-containing protein [Deltaproteobacteria bacterium]
MPSASPKIGSVLKKTLRDLGQRLRDRRKRLGVSATATAEAAGMSRVTLYRIERGEASVAMGAYLSVISALGLKLELGDAGLRHRPSGRSSPKPPQKIRLVDYPQLKRLAWQLKDTKEISPEEALDLYERNWRHVDHTAMDSHEHELVETLLAAFGRERLLV